MKKSYTIINARKGFTLIELLVVIAIIAILASILFPVFARARENARRSSCASNVKQILLGVMQYTQDYDEMYPPSYTYAFPGPTIQGTWYTYTQPYLKSAQIFKCPSDSSTDLAAHSALGDGNGYTVSYIANFWLGGDTSRVSLSAVQSPSTAVYMSDGGVRADGPNITVQATSPAKNGGQRMLIDGTIAAGPNGDYAGPSPRHLETTNVGFADGHVKSMRPENWYYDNSWQLHPECSAKTGVIPCL
jgi:prepilin-type N-terminal cleavage/methylation domain-containing protein/prepilin-type processing-associated H-X9-DG protein